MPSKVTPEEALELSEVTFEWGDSYDAKARLNWKPPMLSIVLTPWQDWDRLRAILAPSLLVDYTEVTGNKWDAMPSAEFVGMVSSHGFVGDPLVDTQHLIGGSKFQKDSDTSATGLHQLRAAHQRYTAADKKEVEAKGHGHALIQHYYKKIDGEWKLAGLKPTVRWNEYNFAAIFKGH